MTLTEIRAAFPDLFYDQEWFDGETFMQSEPRAYSPFFQAATVRLEAPVFPVQAVDLAALYVKDPHKSVWRKFLWTDDVDTYGNRVYVAGVGEYGIESFQIHRRLEPACWWPYLI